MSNSGLNVTAHNAARFKWVRRKATPFCSQHGPALIIRNKLTTNVRPDPPVDGFAELKANFLALWDEYQLCSEDAELLRQVEGIAKTLILLGAGANWGPELYSNLEALLQQYPTFEGRLGATGDHAYFVFSPKKGRTPQDAYELDVSPDAYQNALREVEHGSLKREVKRLKLKLENHTIPGACTTESLAKLVEAMLSNGISPTLDAIRAAAERLCAFLEAIQPGNSNEYDNTPIQLHEVTESSAGCRPDAITEACMCAYWQFGSVFSLVPWFNSDGKVSHWLRGTSSSPSGLTFERYGHAASSLFVFGVDTSTTVAIGQVPPADCDEQFWEASLRRHTFESEGFKCPMDAVKLLFQDRGAVQDHPDISRPTGDAILKYLEMVVAASSPRMLQDHVFLMKATELFSKLRKIFQTFENDDDLLSFQVVFHGSHHSKIDAICNTPFGPTQLFGQRAKYGPGNYFADVNTAIEYCTSNFPADQPVHLIWGILFRFDKSDSGMNQRISRDSSRVACVTQIKEALNSGGMRHPPVAYGVFAAIDSCFLNMGRVTLSAEP